mmetsp:Transcript_152782/g.388219  ORF Transcript_152782/g.388219 Transcript_152782/m.388219 type:complete len:291 (+) Transcript_152782:1488-2360(+)
MEASSRKTVSRFPPGGQNVLPVFLSTSPSIARCSPNGVVALLKFILLDNMVSKENFCKYINAVEVLAVPPPPTIREDRKLGGFRICSKLATMSIMNSARTESTVGINNAENNKRLGAFHSIGAQSFQDRTRSFQSGTYSNIVSLSLQGGIASTSPLACKTSINLIWNLLRSSLSRSPPIPQETEYAKMRKHAVLDGTSLLSTIGCKLALSKFKMLTTCVASFISMTFLRYRTLQSKKSSAGPPSGGGSFNQRSNKGRSTSTSCARPDPKSKRFNNQLSTIGSQLRSEVDT